LKKRAARLILSRTKGWKKMVQSVTDENFETEVLQASHTQPVMVDFWAEWCGPCKMLAPVVEEVAQDLAGKVKVVKMDVDASPHTPGAYNIRGIPTLILFKDGKPAATRVGGLPRAQLAEWAGA